MSDSPSSPLPAGNLPAASKATTDGFQRIWIVGFAGHRKMDNPAAVKAALVRGLSELRDGVEGELTGRASAAAGADLLFLEACRDLGIAYSVVLPFPEARFREDFDDDGAEWSRAKDLMATARCVELAPGGEAAPAAYHLAAREVLDVADTMLFLWDGQPARGIGGTAESVAEARERELPFRVIDAATATLGEMQAGKTEPKPFPWRDPGFDGLPQTASVEALFDELDRRAMKGAPRSRYFTAFSISLNQLATLIYAVLIAFGLGVDAAPAVKFLIVTAAGLLPWLGSRIRIHEVWVASRLRAELLRSVLVSQSFAPVLRPFAADLFLSEAPFLRTAAWRLLPERQPWDEAQQRYLKERLDGQIGYLAEKGEAAAKKLSRLERIVKCASIPAMCLTALAILRGFYHWHFANWIEKIVLTFLPIVLPAIAAWCMAMIPLFEHKRRAGLYRQIVERLKTKRAELAEAKCFTTAAAVVGSCERLLLTELWEWGGSRGQRR